jgi:hypothetical protein
LIPRPESEALVACALTLVPAAGMGRAADVGTGYGAIAVALASERHEWTVDATDISPEALEVARINVERLGLGSRVHLYAGDLCTALPAGDYDLIVCNPPYMEPEQVADLPSEVRDWEPRLAAASTGRWRPRRMAGCGGTVGGSSRPPPEKRPSFAKSSRPRASTRRSAGWSRGCPRQPPSVPHTGGPPPLGGRACEDGSEHLWRSGASRPRSFWAPATLARCPAPDPKTSIGFTPSKRVSSLDEGSAPQYTLAHKS